MAPLEAETVEGHAMLAAVEADTLVAMVTSLATAAVPVVVVRSMPDWIRTIKLALDMAVGR